MPLPHVFDTANPYMALHVRHVQYTFDSGGRGDGPFGELGYL